MDINKLQRENIKHLTPYASARDEFKGSTGVFFDANENNYGSTYNRYPDPRQNALKDSVSKIKGVPPEHIFIGNGSDEAIDLLIRAFCEPGTDNILITPPTYGMYEVCANINGVAVKKAMLYPDFQLDMELIAESIDAHTKIIFLCSPNNPTGNNLNRRDMETILTNFKGLVVIDEAYINFSRQHSMIRELTEYANLIVLQTFSKAWGLAGLRLGMAFAARPVIDILNKIKPPYNISEPTQAIALEALGQLTTVNQNIQQLVAARVTLQKKLSELPFVETVYPSAANFLLVKVKDADSVYKSLLEKGIIVRNRSNAALCERCLRITVGTDEENTLLLTALAALAINNP